MVPGLHPDAQRRLVERLAEELPSIQVQYNSFLLSQSTIRLEKLDAILPNEKSQVRQRLSQFVSEKPFSDFVYDQLSALQARYQARERRNNESSDLMRGRVPTQGLLGRRSRYTVPASHRLSSDALNQPHLLTASLLDDAIELVFYFRISQLASSGLQFRGILGDRRFGSAAIQGLSGMIAA